MGARKAAFSDPRDAKTFNIRQNLKRGSLFRGKPAPTLRKRQVPADELQPYARPLLSTFRRMMDMPFCHMHGPEHHIMVGSALLTAYHNAGGQIDLPKALSEMISRGSKVPGGACGFWGAFGAAISTGMFISIITGSTPLMHEAWGHSNLKTSCSLARLGEIGGPRCCKRNSYTSILTAIDYTERITGVRMHKPMVVCRHMSSNSQCIGNRCPFHPSNQ